MGRSDHGTSYMRVGGDDGKLGSWPYIYEGRRGRWGTETMALHLHMKPTTPAPHSRCFRCLSLYFSLPIARSLSLPRSCPLSVFLSLFCSISLALIRPTGRDSRWRWSTPRLKTPTTRARRAVAFHPNLLEHS